MPDPVRAAALAAALLVFSTANAQDAPPQAFEVCATCHTFVPDEHINGPSLAQLIDRPAGSIAGYRYSGPLRRSGIVWNSESLKEFLRDPQKKVPGNRMPFSGVEDERQLDELVSFLLKRGR